MNGPSNRRQWLCVSLGAAGALALPQRGVFAASAAPSPPLLHWRERALIGFGTTLSLRAAHAQATVAEAALSDAVAAIRHVERQMSLFDPNSALSRLNRDGVLNDPHLDLVAILKLARGVSARSGGSFDVTVQPLWTAWQRARAAGRHPSASELRDARSHVDWRGVIVSPSQLRLSRPGMAVTLNGIAQGYAADLATAALRARGIEHALLDTGEWQALGQGPEQAPWTLGIENPLAAEGPNPSPHAGSPTSLHARLLARLVADGRAMATSSDAHCSFSADRRQHHILDPRSGHSPRELASVTVLAPSAALADALTKVFFMAGWQPAMALARRWQVDVLVMRKDGRWRASAGTPLA